MRCAARCHSSWKSYRCGSVVAVVDFNTIAPTHCSHCSVLCSQQPGASRRQNHATLAWVMHTASMCVYDGHTHTHTHTHTAPCRQPHHLSSQKRHAHNSGSDRWFRKKGVVGNCMAGGRPFGQSKPRWGCKLLLTSVPRAGQKQTWEMPVDIALFVVACPSALCRACQSVCLCAGTRLTCV
jgi:hypothetical protein